MEGHICIWHNVYVNQHFTVGRVALRIPALAMIICCAIVTNNWEICRYILLIESFDFLYCRPPVSLCVAGAVICGVIIIPGVPPSIQLHKLPINKPIICIIAASCSIRMILECQRVLIAVIVYIDNRTAFWLDRYVLIITIQMEACILIIGSIYSCIGIIPCSCGRYCGNSRAGISR